MYIAYYYSIWLTQTRCVVRSASLASGAGSAAISLRNRRDDAYLQRISSDCSYACIRVYGNDDITLAVIPGDGMPPYHDNADAAIRQWRWLAYLHTYDLPSYMTTMMIAGNSSSNNTVMTMLVNDWQYICVDQYDDKPYNNHCWRQLLNHACYNALWRSCVLCIITWHYSTVCVYSLMLLCLMYYLTYYIGWPPEAAYAANRWRITYPPSGHFDACDAADLPTWCKCLYRRVTVYSVTCKPVWRDARRTLFGLLLWSNRYAIHSVPIRYWWRVDIVLCNVVTVACALCQRHSRPACKPTWFCYGQPASCCACDGITWHDPMRRRDCLLLARRAGSYDAKPPAFYLLMPPRNDGEKAMINAYLTAPA